MRTNISLFVTRFFARYRSFLCHCEEANRADVAIRSLSLLGRGFFVGFASSE